MNIYDDAELLHMQHAQLVNDLLHAAPGSERARELRAMIARLERIQPDLERNRINILVRKTETPPCQTILILTIPAFD